MSTLSKPKPSLGVTRNNVPGVLARAGIMEAAIELSPAMFPALPIPMPVFVPLIQAAAEAQSAAAARTNGLAALRDTKVDALWTAMQSVKTYVGGLASALDATSAASLIQAAGLLVAQTPTHTKLLLSATYAPAALGRRPRSAAGCSASLPREAATSAQISPETACSDRASHREAVAALGVRRSRSGGPPGFMVLRRGLQEIRPLARVLERSSST